MTEYEQLLIDCEHREGKLSDWERTFIDSLRRQIEDGRRPTTKQLDRLDEIWEKVTNAG